MARQEVTCDNIKRLQTPVIHNENNFEHALTYYRPDGSRVELAFIHIPGQEPTVAMAVYPAKSGSDDIPAPSALIERSLDELRVHLHFVEYLRDAGLLDR